MFSFIVHLIAAYGNVSLSAHCPLTTVYSPLVAVLALFRLRIAPKGPPSCNKNFQLVAPVYDRLCSFCVKSACRRFLEDEYIIINKCMCVLIALYIKVYSLQIAS
jgi:hypothetical protein